MNNATGYIAYQLKGLMADRAIASLFTDPNNPDDFIAGFVQAVNNRTTLVNAITPYGMMDGYFAIRLGAILEVQYDSIYAQRLALLMRMGNQGPQLLPIREEEDALAFLLGISQRRGVAVTLWTASESYAGFVTQANDLFLGMEPVDFMGNRCAEMTFRLTDIEMVSLGSEEERMYERLDKHHQERGE